MSIQKYLQNANKAVHEQFIGVDGFSDNANWTGAEDFYYADAAAAPAAAAAPVAQVMRSQPYIISIANSNGSVTPIDIFGAYEYLNNAGFSGGSLTVGGVTISSNLSNTTYYNLLNQSSVSPFTIGATLISSVAGTVSQVLNPITLTTQDANGNQAIKILTPTIDPYQNQAGVIELKQAFRIDGFTKLTLNMFATSTVQFQFYPADNINIARGLAGNPVSRQYGSPQIIRPAAR
jgi:hypothetical protein